MRFELRRDVDDEAHSATDAHLQNVEIGLDQFNFLAKRRRADAQLGQRRPQVIDQVTEQRARFLRTRFRQILDRCERVEQEVRFNLLLHQLELRLDRLFRQQVAIGLGLVERRRGARLAELDEEDKADQQPVDKGREEIPREPMVPAYVFERIAFGEDDEHETQKRADEARQRESNDRPGLIPRGRNVDAIRDREPVQLDRHERMPKGPWVVDPQDAGDAGVDRADQQERLPVEAKALEQRVAATNRRGGEFHDDQY